jgi:hypothetical protein
MHPELRNSASTGADLTVLLDGQPVALPAERRSLAAIRAYLEIRALERQRILFSLRVDGARTNLSAPLTQRKFARVEAETIGLSEVPLQLIRTALLQTVEAKTQVLSAVSLVVINDPACAREIWWNLVRTLNQPILTLSLMPEQACGTPLAGASLMQLRKWQLEQLATILKEVDEAAWSEDSAAVSNSLEFRVLPWLQGLETSLGLWRDSLMASPQSALAVRD